LLSEKKRKSNKMQQRNRPSIFNRFPGELKEKNLPVPPRFISLLGPGMIMLAAALGSGEIYFWPGITMKYGFSLIWPAIIAITLQYVLNTEFARYTITTGETIITGFTRLWKPFGWIFLICTTLPWVWPGWSMGGATAITWITGGRPETIAIISLLVIGLSLTTTRIVYKTLESIEKVLVIGVITFLIFISFFVIGKDSFSALGEGLISTPFQIPSDLKISTLLAALAFCGAGGSLNLATSNWVRDKGFGMGKYIPRITSAFSGDTITTQKSGYYFPLTDTNKSLWKRWWFLIQKEQFITFYLVGLIGLILLMLVSHSLLFGADLEIGVGFLKEEGIKLNEKIGFISPALFYILVAAVFFTTAFGVLDHVARISADIINTQISSKKFLNINITESKLYFVVLWGMILFGIFVLTILNIDQPPSLLATAGSLSGMVMFIYSFLILVLNIKLKKSFQRNHQDKSKFNPFNVSLIRQIILGISIIFYGWFSISLIIGLF